LRKDVRAVIVDKVEKENGARLSSFSLGLPTDGTLVVEATIRTSHVLHQSQINDLEKELQHQVGRPVRLEVQQVQLAVDDADRSSSNYLGGGTVRQDRAVATAELLTPDTALNLIEKELGEVGKPLGLTNLQVNSVRLDAVEGITVEFEALQESAGTPQAWSVLAASLQNRLKARVVMKGTIEIIGTPGYEVKFGAGAATLGPVEQRRIEAYLRQIEADQFKPRLVAPPADTEGLEAKVKALSSKFPNMELIHREGQAALKVVPVQTLQVACCEAAPPVKPSVTSTE
jgi:hypothetical protein